MKKSIKSLIRIGIFLIILSLILVFFNSVFKFKYDGGIYKLTKFYELEDNTVDVLIVGSSHSYCGFCPGILWDEYGMTAYCMGGASQPMWNSYYFIKEALKTQKPKLIVLEVYAIAYSAEYADDINIIKNNFGFHLSDNKIDSLKVSAPEDRWSDFLLEYTHYHSRYKDISSEDFLEDKGNPYYYDWKGQTILTTKKSRKAKDISSITDSADLYPKEEEYYRKILELAKEENIPIAVVIAPWYTIAEIYQMRFNAGGIIAENAGVPFINCNLFLDEIGIDFSTDNADIAGHLNLRGSVKFTHFIGKYLSEQFDIPDHRDDPEYESWQRNADYTRQILYDWDLSEIADADELIEKTKNPNYWIFISVDGISSTSDEAVQEYLKKLGVTKMDERGIWFIKDGKNVWKSGIDENEKYQRTNSHDFLLRRSAIIPTTTSDQSIEGETVEDDHNNEIIIDLIQYNTKVKNGINVVIYDTLAEKIADSFGLDADAEYAVTR